ncbi:peptidase U32 family protein [Anaeromicropila populeti]|uniref:Putative protease n=1 Tax=Anaeromicropila populeti TaxID=37658 RepID=A0A1I6JM21_9FIRM|nr:U32 family peptidase [Anaeromicropila populeti]SFR80004.1 putative protease [Anaeromicropila populeti]
MKVLVPLNNREHIDDYLKAGAGEFYIGFYDKAWVERFGDYADINRLTGYKEDANPFDFDTILEIIEEVKNKGIMIYVTFNSSMYSGEQLEFIRQYFTRLQKTRVDGVIVSCMELMELARETGVAAVVSTISGVYNSDIVKFYKERGAKRIILPRDLLVEEIGTISAALPDMEYEVFMMRNGCSFSDSNCLGLHRQEMCAICSSLRNSKKEVLTNEKGFQPLHNTEWNNFIYNHFFHQDACGLCALYQFVKMGIAACKIVGRSDEWEAICHDIAFVKKNIDIAEKCESEEEFLEEMAFPNSRKAICKMGLSCYYPEIRFQ